MKARFLYLLFACVLASPFTAEAQQTKLRATLQLPATDALLGKSLVRFKEDVEKRSNNAISLEIFDKGKLYIDDRGAQTVCQANSRHRHHGAAVPFQLRRARAGQRKPRQRDTQAD